MIVKTLCAGDSWPKRTKRNIIWIFLLLFCSCSLNGDVQKYISSDDVYQVIKIVPWEKNNFILFWWKLQNFMFKSRQISPNESVWIKLLVRISVCMCVHTQREKKLYFNVFLRFFLNSFFRKTHLFFIYNLGKNIFSRNLNFHWDTET